MFRRGGRSIQGPLPTRFTDRLQHVLQFPLGALVCLVLALAIQPIRVDAPMMATKELGQIEALRQQPMDLIVGPRLNPIDTVALGKRDDERETGVLNRLPKILPGYS